MSTIDTFNPLVSIVVPVYNGANYMREAIDSALAQTYKNIEIIVVNDGSRDNGETDRIARGYGERIRYFQKENGGCGSALNLGISQMRGEYFSWLSHDDVYYPDKIEHQINILRTLENRGTILYCGWEGIDQKSKSMFHVRPETTYSLQKLDTPIFPLLRGIIHGCSLLVPAGLFRTVGTFNEALPTTQDYALWFEFMRAAPVRFDSRILIKSRIHSDQSTHRISTHVEECNELWCGFLDRLTDAEMEAMEGSRYLFLRQTAKFLATTPYDKARDRARSMADTTLRNIKVSVVMPFFNCIRWTLEAVRSVQAQTHQTFDIVLVDDGSTDDMSELRETCRRDRRINLVHSQHAGAAAARNRGVSVATGEYVAFLDSDDLFCETKLEEQLQYMEDNSLQFSHTSYLRMNVEGTVLGVVESGTFSGDVFPRIIASCPIATPTVMGKRSLFLANKFPEDLEIGEDVCLWITLAGSHRIGALPAALSKVRVGESTAAFHREKQAIGMINISSYVIHHPHYRQFHRQIRSLLLDIAALYDSGAPASPEPIASTSPAAKVPERVSPPAAPPSPLVPIPRPGLLAMTLRSWRNDGPRVTFYRIRRRLRMVR